MACESCRVKKTKCDKGMPACSRCRLRSIPCKYIRERQKRQHLDSAEITARLRRMESLMQAIHSNPEPIEHHGSTSHSMNQNTDPQRISTSATLCVGPSPINSDLCTEEALPRVQNLRAEDMNTETNTEPLPALVVPEISNLAAPAIVTSKRRKIMRPQADLLDQILSGNGRSDKVDNNAAIWIRTTAGDEYIGPSSGVSVFSAPGVRWLQDKFGANQELCDKIKGITIDLGHHLQLLKCLPFAWNPTDRSRPRKPLPTQDVIWKYVDGYFEKVQWLYPILNWSAFESRLRGWLEAPSCCDDAWFALLNAILALGSRAVLSAGTSTAFEHSAQEGWDYFRNAVDLEMNLVHKGTSLTAIQALVAMAVYGQGLSSPQRVEYSYCSIAARMAQTLGLNRQPLAAWKLSGEEIEERNRLFWIIYVLDKTIALRSGRTAAIDDDEISCAFPRDFAVIQRKQPELLHGDDQHYEDSPFDFFLALARFARIAGKISKRLYSARALSVPSYELSYVAAELTAEIIRWRDDIPTSFRPGNWFAPAELPRNVSLLQALTVNFGYNYAICAISRRFSGMFIHMEADFAAVNADKILAVTATMCLEAARSMILLTKDLDIESHAPSWLLFYYPMTALTTIFVHVVADPLSDSAGNDVALMEAAVGHFGRLEFLTAGGTAFTKIGELVRLARRVMETAESSDESQTTNDRERTAQLATSPQEDYEAEDGQILDQTADEAVNFAQSTAHQAPNIGQDYLSSRLFSDITTMANNNFMPDTLMASTTSDVDQEWLEWQVRSQQLPGEEWSQPDLEALMEEMHQSFVTSS